MDIVAPLLILVSALGLIIYLRRRARRRGGSSSFNPPPYDYGDTSDDGLGTGVYPPPVARRRGERGMFDDLPDDDDEDGLPSVLGKVSGPPEDRIVRPRRVSPDDRRPADGDDVLLNTLLYGAPTGAPMQRDEARAVVREVLREEGPPEPSRVSDGDGRPGFGGGRSEGGGATGDYSNSSPDSGGGGGSGE